MPKTKYEAMRSTLQDLLEETNDELLDTTSPGDRQGLECRRDRIAKALDMPETTEKKGG